MYILLCSDGSYYIGSTNDLERRISQHQNCEGANHTKKRLPVKLVYYEVHQTARDAFYREKEIQKWSRKKKEALINSFPDDLKKYAECMNESHCKNYNNLNTETNIVASTSLSHPVTLNLQCNQT
ncbi:MAG: GIY-YIG nuclease family protein [Paludibacter sp.]|nr:GIY-YIG nuclease family protein [Paludibacter sp.]